MTVIEQGLISISDSGSTLMDQRTKFDQIDNPTNWDEVQYGYSWSGTGDFYDWMNDVQEAHSYCDGSAASESLVRLMAVSLVNALP